MFELIEISRETYGHDHRAINRHQERRYRAPSGMLYALSRTLDGQPPFFETYGPFSDDHRGFFPRLQIQGLNHWGDGWSWERAFNAFERAVRRRELSLLDGKDRNEATKSTESTPAG